MTLDDLRGKRNLLFWALHSLGWSAYMIAQYVGALLYDKPAAYIKVLAIAATSGFLFSAPLRYLYRWLWSKSPTEIFTGVMIGSWLTALAWRATINYSYESLVEHWMEKEPWWAIFSGTLSSTYLLLLWSGLYFGIKYYETLQTQREAALRASALAQEAQVKMLRYQLNPHFLFNTLNAISTLILDGQGRIANLAVTRLSDFLRYTLDKDPMKKVSLRQEIDALNLYLGIEKLRFGDRLRLRFDIEDAAYQAQVPSLILQPLIENALKYAVAPREEGGELKIEGCVRGKSLGLSVQDDGPGLPPGVEAGTGRGVGLRNTRERLAVLYSDHNCVAMRDARPGLRIEITLPYERAAQL
jgi:two-component sensor histidine kinase